MRRWNKATIEEQLKLHKKQNKDDRYNYFAREFNCLWYCWELEEYTIKENKRLNNIINKTKQYIKENILSFNEVDMADIKVILDMLEDK